MAFGYGDTQFINFPEGQTDTRVRTAQNQLGINALEFVRRVDAAMADVNRIDPLIASLTFPTTRREVRQGGRENKVWQRSAEYTPGRVQRQSGGAGFQRPLYFYEIDLGFTRRALMRMGLDQFNEELRGTASAIRRGRRADVLNRLFDPAEWPLDDDGVGASPAFAGSGTGANEFVGYLPNNTQTDANYTHYFQAENTEAGIHTALLDMVAHLKNFNEGDVFDMMGSVEAIDLIRTFLGDDKFVPAGSTLVRPGEAVSAALVDPSVYVGVYNGRIRVRPGDTQIQGLNLAVYRTGGANSPLNPLAYVYDPLFGRDAIVDDRQLFPLTEAMIQQTYAIGVGDSRANAALLSIGGTNGVYAKPVIFR